MKDPAGQIRCDNDLKLYERLLAHPEVSRVREAVEKQEENRNGPGVRRHLLSTSVRLSRSMSSALHEMADRCQARLGIESKLELYVYSAPQFNAACFKPEDGRVYITTFRSATFCAARRARLRPWRSICSPGRVTPKSLPIGLVPTARRIFPVWRGRSSNSPPDCVMTR